MTDDKQVQEVKGKKHRIAEVAGGTAAECAAVCCCPCAVVHFALMALYTIPKELVKRAVTMMKKQDRALDDGTTATTTTNNNNDVVVMIEGEKESAETVAVTTALEEKESTDSVVALDNEMWARFAGTGFWRSQSRSQRDP